MIRPSAAALAAILLAACTGPTPYQPAGETGLLADPNGYAAMRIEPGRYRISFTGNSRTPRETVEIYLLRQAAEVTLDAGADWFRIVDRDTEQQRELITTGGPIGPYGFGYYPFWPRYGRFGRGYGDFAPFPYEPIRTREVRKYEAFAEILVGQGAKPPGDSVYDARAVLADTSSASPAAE